MEGENVTAIELKHQANLQRWAEAIQECRSSGVSVKAWCERQGITTTTYYRWERTVLSKAEGLQQAPARVSFAELPTPKQMQRSVAQQVATLRYKEVSLDIYPGMDADTMQMLMTALRTC